MFYIFIPIVYQFSTVHVSFIKNCSNTINTQVMERSIPKPNANYHNKICNCPVLEDYLAAILNFNIYRMVKSQ